MSFKYFRGENMINILMNEIFGHFGLSWGFFSDYVTLLIWLSVLTHMVLFKRELKKELPQIPYIQDIP